MEKATERIRPTSRPPTRFSDTPRVLAGLLAVVEKRCLVWMAKRLPAWVSADHLTALGAMAMVMAGLSYWFSRWHPIGLVAVIFWLAVNWFGDSLDGTLARVRNHLRPRYGFYVDHVVDMIGQFCLVGGMGLSGYMHPPIALGLIIVFYMLSIEAYLATHTRGRFRMSFWGFGPTELRVIIAIGNIRLLYKPTAMLFGQTFLLFDAGAVIAMVCMAATLVVAIVRNAHALYLEEPLPRQAG
jgi:archaetidylinositol phosphate synthase